MTQRIFSLIKIFDAEEHAERFLKQGEMLCRTLEHFKKIENNDERGDKYEAVVEWQQPEGIKLKLSYCDKDGKKSTFSIDELAGPFVVQTTAYDNLNIYCMYALKIEAKRTKKSHKDQYTISEIPKISEKCSKLGNFAVVIHQVTDFIELVRNHARSNGYFFTKGAVRYFDPKSFSGNFAGIETVFQKRNLYSHQSEFRFAFDFFSEKPEPRKIQIGSLEKIAIKVPTEELNNIFKIVPAR